MSEKLSSMTPEERAELVLPLQWSGPRKPDQLEVEVHRGRVLAVAEAIATAEAEAYAAGRKAERGRIIDWIKAEARDCGCSDRILKQLESDHA